MRCGTTRKILYMANRPTLPSPQWVEAQEHFGRCPACQQFFADEEALQRFLRTRLAKHEVPAHLRERVLGQFAQSSAQDVPSSRPRAARRRWVSVASVAMLVGIAGVLGGVLGYYDVLTGDDQRVVDELTEDHLRFGPGISSIASSQADDVKAWFKDKVHFAVDVPRFNHVELVGGRLCYLLGKKGALVSYRAQEKPVSLYIIDGTDVDLSRLAPVNFGGGTFARASQRGQQMILWKRRYLVYALVSDLPEFEMVDLAARIRIQQG